MTSAQEVVTALQGASLTVATAESLTGGLLCAALTDVPGASTVVRGAVVAYATEVKSSVLGVDAQVLRSGGAVQGVVATQMATGAARALGSDLGVATTGVAGPDPQDGQPVGTVFVAVSLAGRREVRRLRLTGSRAEIRTATVQAALRLVAEVLGVQEDPELRGR